LALAYVIGAIPFSNVIARRYHGQDLRHSGTGTATPANLHRIAGPRPAILAGAIEVAKGAVGPVLVGFDRPVLAAVAGGLAVMGHNWSPFLRGRGGRGISTATGALLVVAWPGAVFMCGCLAVGVLARRVLPVMRAATFALLPVLVLVEGKQGLVVGAILTAPIGFKTTHEIYRRRLLRPLRRRRGRDARDAQDLAGSESSP
jgi:glycerol-3-phosphate acyltransferase PlsY